MLSNAEANVRTRVDKTDALGYSPGETVLALTMRRDSLAKERK